MGNTRDLNTLLGELRRQLTALSRAIETFEDLAERKIEEHHSKSRSMTGMSKTLASDGSAGEGRALATVWSRPEPVTAAAADPSSLRARES